MSLVPIPEGQLAAVVTYLEMRAPPPALARVRDGDSEVGMLELDFREPGACELVFVGLVLELSGQGHGRWLLAEAVARAWGRDGVARVHVHTFSFDHRAALAAYRRAGFVAIARKIETFIDPRLAGVLPRDAAPQVPLLVGRS